MGMGRAGRRPRWRARPNLAHPIYSPSHGPNCENGVKCVGSEKCACFFNTRFCILGSVALDHCPRTWGEVGNVPARYSLTIRHHAAPGGSCECIKQDTCETPPAPGTLFKQPMTMKKHTGAKASAPTPEGGLFPPHWRPEIVSEWKGLATWAPTLRHADGGYYRPPGTFTSLEKCKAECDRRNSGADLPIPPC